MKDSGLTGYGVYATTFIPSGTALKLLSGWRNLRVIDKHSIINTGGKKKYKSLKGTHCTLDGPIYFVNHTCMTPNVEFTQHINIQKGLTVEMMTKSDIFVGEELLVNYGDEFFDMKTKDCLCEWHRKQFGPPTRPLPRYLSEK